MQKNIFCMDILGHSEAFPNVMPPYVCLWRFMATYGNFFSVVRGGGDRRGAALVVAAWAMLRRPLPPEGGADPALQFERPVPAEIVPQAQ